MKKGLPSRGDLVFRQNGNITVTVWQDKKPIVVISSQHNPCVTATVKRKKNTVERIDVVCPQAVVDYNTYMGGVDIGDQYRHYFQVRMKSRKFYKYTVKYHHSAPNRNPAPPPFVNNEQLGTF